MTMTINQECCRNWVTHPWMKWVWEKAHHLRMEIDIANLPVHRPRKRDKWLRKEFVVKGKQTF
jgi:hypothetical protein